MKESLAFAKTYKINVRNNIVALLQWWNPFYDYCIIQWKIQMCLKARQDGDGWQWLLCLQVLLMSREGTWVPPIDPLLSFVMFMVIIKLLLLLVFITRIKLNCIWSLAKRTFLQKLVYVLTTLFFFYKKTLHLYEHFSCNGPSENMHRHHPKGLLCQVHT